MHEVSTGAASPMPASSWGTFATKYMKFSKDEWHLSLWLGNSSSSEQMWVPKHLKQQQKWVDVDCERYVFLNFHRCGIIYLCTRIHTQKNNPSKCLSQFPLLRHHLCWLPAGGTFATKYMILKVNDIWETFEIVDVDCERHVFLNFHRCDIPL